VVRGPHNFRWPQFRPAVLHPSQSRLFTSDRVEALQYHPLNRDAKEIRLLMMLPTPTGADEPISCQMFSVPLDSAPLFVSLSYAWGDPTITRPILINGRILHVTENLEAALRRFHEGEMSSPNGSRRWWVDAVCINQADDAEKSWQVGQMRDVFKKAAEVAIWLGPSDETSVIALNWATQLRGSVGFVPYAAAATSENRAEKFPVHAIGALLQRSWWRRVWVLQELANAKKATIVCGNQFIQAHLFFEIIIHAQKVKSALAFMKSEQFNQQWAEATGADQLMSTKISSHASVMTGFWYLTQAANPLPLLADVILQTCFVGFHSTDPRDAIFAKLGLARDSVDLGLFPDYTKDTKEVFIQASKALLEAGYVGLLTLCGEQNSTLTSDLPSFVPDWSAQSDTAMTHMLGLAGISTPMCYSASGGLMPTIKFDEENPLQFRTEAYFVDTVKHLGETCLPGEGLELLRTSDPEFIGRKMEEVCQWVHGLLTFVLKHYGEEYYDAILMRVSICDAQLTSGSGAGVEYRRASPATVHAYRMFKMLLEMIEKDPTYTFASLPLIATQYAWNVVRLSAGRRPFITATNFMGMGPSSTQEEDQVAIILGLDVPMILRKQDDGTYKIVGHAYVDQLMDGDAFHLPESREVETITIS